MFAIKWARQWTNTDSLSAVPERGRRFNLINIHLLIFPFGRCAGHHPLGLPRLAVRAPPSSSSSSSSSSRIAVMLRRTRATRRCRRTSILFAVSLCLFAHAFVLRLLTASRALRKPATSYARLHFINFGFLRFSLHTACRRVVRRFPGKPPREPRKPRDYVFLFDARSSKAKKEGGDAREEPFINSADFYLSYEHVKSLG